MTLSRMQRLTCVASILALAACANGPGLPDLGRSMIPEYRPALDSHPDDLLAYFRAWLSSDKPVAEEPGAASWSFRGSEASIARGADRLLAGYEAYCNGRQGQVLKDPQAEGLRCMGERNELLSQLSVEVLHPKDASATELRFTVETAERLFQAQEAQASRYRQVTYTLAGNGPAGDVLLDSGEALDVLRFGRLTASDAYAVELPQRGLIAFTELLSVRWGEGRVRVMMLDGSVVEEAGPTLTPAKTLVRLVPGTEPQVAAVPLTGEAPFRFVTVDARSKLPRQVRLRSVDQLLKVTVSPKPALYKSGPIETTFEKKERDAFTKTLLADARKAAARLARKPPRLDLDDSTQRDELETLGRGGPCARAQTDAGLKTGDIALTEFFVCAQYRAESSFVLKNGGQLAPDRTPLLYLSKAAGAPWYDFDGVMR
jgi:hypothetical protein